MPDNDAEVSVVKNGTLMRWTGSDAERIALFLSRCGFRDPDEPVRMGDLDIGPPTVTKPLRHVEEVVGWVDSDFRGTICLERTGPGEVNAVQIDCVVPDECIAKGDEEPKTYRFRFVAEAEAVEEKDR